MKEYRLFSYILVLLSCVYVSYQTLTDANIEILHKWTFADFLYPSQQSRSVAISQQLYVPQNIAILDTDYYFSPVTSTKRIFVTTPQFRNGIPATVSEVSRETNSRGEYLLKPFPNWDSIGTASCEFPLSVYRIHIDKCGLLWVLDTGRVNTFVSPVRQCRPKVLVYDLKNGDTLITRYEFPDGSINDRSNLITLVPESYQEDCLDSIAYIADVNAYGLVVFDLARQTSWRVEHNFFYPFPNHGTMTVAGVTFDLMDGVFGLALGPGDPVNRKLYFHSLASLREVSVPVGVLKNTTLVGNAEVLRHQLQLSDEGRYGQSSLEVMTDDGILLFSDLPKLAIMCWNSNTKFDKKNIHVAYQNNEDLQFVSGMKLKRNKSLVITTSRLQNYIAGILNGTDVKYRMIIIDDVHELLKGSPCKDPHAASRPSGGQRPNSSPHNTYDQHGGSYGSQYGQNSGQYGQNSNQYGVDERFDSSRPKTTSPKPLWNNRQTTPKKFIL